MKYYVLDILRDGSWKSWKEIYASLPEEPKPSQESFQRYLRNLTKYGRYRTIIVEKDGKSIEKKKYLIRRYIYKKKERKKVYYRISKSGLGILRKIEQTGFKLQRSKGFSVVHFR